MQTRGLDSVTSLLRMDFFFKKKNEMRGKKQEKQTVKLSALSF